MGIFGLFTGEPPQLVRQALNDVQFMLRRGHEMFAAATAYLLDNEILDVDLHEMDREINQREQNIRRLILEHLTIAPQDELLFSLKLVSVVQEAERIGDLSKTLAKTGALAKKPRMGDAVEPLRQMRDRILQMFEQAHRGFVESDEQAARNLMEEHSRIKDEVTAYLGDLSNREDLTVNEGIVYSMSARMISRVSSHLANIVSAVVLPFDRIRRAPTWDEAKR